MNPLVHEPFEGFEENPLRRLAVEILPCQVTYLFRVLGPSTNYRRRRYSVSFFFFSILPLLGLEFKPETFSFRSVQAI